jgi:hypothetical protein
MVLLAGAMALSSRAPRGRPRGCALLRLRGGRAAGRGRRAPGLDDDVLVFNHVVVHDRTRLTSESTTDARPSKRATTEVLHDAAGSIPRRQARAFASAVRSGPCRRRCRCRWVARGPRAGGERAGPPPPGDLPHAPRSKDIVPLRPEDTRLVEDDSPRLPADAALTSRRCCGARRPRTTVTVGHRGALDVMPYQLVPAHEGAARACGRAS